MYQTLPFNINYNPQARGTPSPIHLLKSHSPSKSERLQVSTIRFESIICSEIYDCCCTLASSAHDALTSPAVRYYLARYGLDAQKIQGSGKKGRILKGDVLEFVRTGS